MMLAVAATTTRRVAARHCAARCASGRARDGDDAASGASRSSDSSTSSRRSAAAVAKEARALHAAASRHPAVRAKLAEIIRVDHAGEYGAKLIYAGQLAVLGDDPTIAHMAEQEERHLATFDKLIGEYRVRPTVLRPLWTVFATALGVGSALLGREAAMACTVAVETVIGEHYDAQLRDLFELKRRYGYDDPALAATLREFRDDELEHLDTGIEHHAERAPQYQALTSAIKMSTQLAVAASQRF